MLLVLLVLFHQKSLEISGTTSMPRIMAFILDHFGELEAAMRFMVLLEWFGVACIAKGSCIRRVTLRFLPA